ncbi:hypothetical protein GOP47_0011530 [Adiantum capillus-veneris]|uniref:Uncharacterized protein n=1 Tax=Adiantum capillus-veneris TaxID=13818 RepID=A0A9D4UTF2_ADICA|nr:hypothetical protein GOP47_0011530 [Adiantum capillus-veneris]
MGRAPCCEKVGLNRGPWTREEDVRLIEYIQNHGGGCWRTLPKAAGLLRCGKSCRLRWINYLRPDLKRGNISEEEDKLIIKLHSMLGNRWSLIAGRLPGRTDNEIKNYWNTHLKKKLRNMGIDPQTHAPLVDTATKPGALVKKRLPTITNQPHAALITSTNHLSTSLTTPANHLSRRSNHQLNQNFKAKPLDVLPSAPLHLLRAMPLISESSSSPSFTSLLAPSLSSAKAVHTPLPSSSLSSLSVTTHFAGADCCCNSHSPFSLPSTSPILECHPQFLPMLALSHPKPYDTLSSHLYTSVARYDQSTSCFPWSAPSSISLVGAAPSASSSFSSASSSASSCAYPLSRATDGPSTYHGNINHSTCYGDLEDVKDVELNTKDNGNVQHKFVEHRRSTDIGVDPNVDDEKDEASLMKDCDLSLMESELMWDMEMIHCFQEVCTPTTSSMPTCSSSNCNLWSHDVISCCYNASPLNQTWINASHDQ